MMSFLSVIQLWIAQKRPGPEWAFPDHSQGYR
jgi:hypothetical protein